MQSGVSQLPTASSSIHIQDEHVRQLRIGEMLTMLSKMKADDVERVLGYQKEHEILFGEAAISLGIINRDDLSQILAEQFQFPYIHEKSGDLDASLITAYQPESHEAELYRSMRSQLLLRWFDKGHKLLSVVSTNTHDEGSQLIANLSIVFAQLNKRTLLIDANLRQRNQYRLFNLDYAPGLSNILANRQGKYEFYKPHALKNLSILPAGTEVPNPQELLIQHAFTSLLKELEQLYDVILIDTAPMSLGLDMQTVVAKTKGVLIAVRRNVTQAALLKELQQQLSVADAMVLGSALTD